MVLTGPGAPNLLICEHHPAVPSRRDGATSSNVSGTDILEENAITLVQSLVGPLKSLAVSVDATS